MVVSVHVFCIRLYALLHFQIKITYIADFNPSQYPSVTKIVHRYLLVPADLDKVPNLRNPYTYYKNKVYRGQYYSELRKFITSLRNVSEWMVVEKDKFDFSRSSCNKIGVGYTAFRYQTDACTSRMGRWVPCVKENGTKSVFIWIMEGLQIRCWISYSTFFIKINVFIVHQCTHTYTHTVVFSISHLLFGSKTKWVKPV